MARRWFAAAVMLGIVFAQAGCGPKKAADDGRPAVAADAPAAAEADSAATAHKPEEAPKITLKIGFPPGRYEMVQEMDMKMTIDMTMEGQDPPPTQQVNQKMTFWSTMDVSQPDAAGNTTMKVQFTRMKQEMDGLVQMSLDTDDVESLKNNPLGKMLAGLCETTMTIVVDADGKAIEVKGVDEMWDRMAKDAPAGAGAVIGSFKQSMGNNAMARMYTQPMAMAPEEPVGIGSVWRPEITIPMPMMGDMVFRNECELVSIGPADQGYVATVKVSGTATAEKGQKQQFGPASVTIDSMDLDMNGQILVNVDSGVPVDESIDLSGTYDMTSSAGKVEVKMTVSMEGTTRTTVTTVK